VTCSLGECLDEFTNAPSNPAPTFDRLTQFKRDYARLTPKQRELFRAAVRRFVAPLATSPPGDVGQPLIRELEAHAGLWQLHIDRDTRAIYAFGDRCDEVSRTSSGVSLEVIQAARRPVFPSRR
jgi:hypothetical protein